MSNCYWCYGKDGPCSYTLEGEYWINVKERKTGSKWQTVICGKKPEWMHVLKTGGMYYSLLICNNYGSLRWDGGKI